MVEPKRAGIHFHFEKAFQNRAWEELSRPAILEVVQGMFPGFPVGSVVPTDHAEPDPNHVNQCNKCADPSHRIFDTVKEGHCLPGKAIYRVRDFKLFPR